MELKRKSPLQIQALEKFYEEQKYPTHEAMEDLASILELTYKQVRTWFIEKRRRDKSKNISIVPPTGSRKLLTAKGGRNGLGVALPVRKMVKQRDPLICSSTQSDIISISQYRIAASEIEGRVGKRKKNIILQNLLTSDYILSKIFRKDGPPLGSDFDCIPGKGFRGFKDSRYCNPPLQEIERANKRRKDCDESAPVIKHGMGKGLMTIWRATNPNGRAFPGTKISSIPRTSTPVAKESSRRNRKRQPSLSVMIQRRLANKLQEKKKPPFKRKKVEPKQDEIQKQSLREKCELALGGVVSAWGPLNQHASLMDDEELELRELQAGPNTIGCSHDCSNNGLLSCSLCKDLLPKFPPNSVKMKHPFAMQPWDSSSETVKNLFKVFHFLYTYSVTVEICSFTLDEFAQAFHDKDSLLLGKIHVALLKLLISDVKTEINSGSLHHSSIPCKFLALLHSVEDEQLIMEFWEKSLNSLTWTEILRQVLVAAGFGSKQGAFRKEAISKEMRLMMKYGLCLGTLKGELFRLLLERGNNGSKVSNLAKSSQIAELNLASTTEELELLICSTLSSDITLFEKISSSAYRLRLSALEEESDFLSDMEDSGSVHDALSYGGTCSTSDSECDSENPNARKIKCIHSHKNLLTVYNEIDESNPGELWLLGLMEGEYSDLSIEEKLNALVALTDLLSAGSSIRMEDPLRPTVECVSKVHHCSGAKVKRSSSKQDNLPRLSWVHAGQMSDAKEGCTSSEFRPVDSSMTIFKIKDIEKISTGDKNAKETEYLHPMQSIFLGSDRRYNRYWLFLGPCDSFDPGHKRVYFESSEDGHWEVIDSEEALHALLSVLDDRGTREALLIESLEKREAFLCQEMSNKVANNDAEVRQSTQSEKSEIEIVREDSSSPVSDVDNNLSLTDNQKDSLPACGAIVIEAGEKGEEEIRKQIRLQKFDAWIWNDFYCGLSAVKLSKKSYFESLTRCETCHDLYWRDEKHCKICHTTFELDFDLEERYAIHSATCRANGDNETFPKHKVLSSQLQSLKAAVYVIESAMPEDALVGAWTKTAHRLWVKRLRRTSCLAELLQVTADFVAAINEDWIHQCNLEQDSNTFMEDVTACFPTMPQTSSALALWLVKLDDLISPYLERVKCAKNTKCSGNES